jgi:hypothetical protein
MLIYPADAAVTAPPVTPTAAPTPEPTPTPEPVVEDPAVCAQMAWDALFTYDGHEAPVRVLGLFTEEGGPGDALYQAMLEAGKLMPKGAYYANAGEDAEGWAAAALQAVPVGLLDSIYAETPELALAAYGALRKAARNDAVEVICAGVTEDVLAAMREDHFCMGAAAGAYENQITVVYAKDIA